MTFGSEKVGNSGAVVRFYPNRICDAQVLRKVVAESQKAVS